MENLMVSQKNISKKNIIGNWSIKMYNTQNHYRCQMPLLQQQILQKLS
jgi:hypothetical protein